MLQGANSYTELLQVGIEGACADATPKTVSTFVNESEAVPYGRMIAFDSTGTTDRSGKLTNAAADVLLGISMLSHADESFDSALTGIAQVTTATVGGTPTDGVYSFDLAFGDGSITTTISVTRSTTPATNNDLATALAAAVNADPVASLYVSAAPSTADVVITKLTPGSFAADNPVAPAPGTLVLALTTGGEADAIKASEEGNALRKGVIWLRPENAVTPASGVFIRHTANAGVGTALGGFRGTADGGNTRDISAFARWVTSSVGGLDGGLAKLEINLPG